MRLSLLAVAAIAGFSLPLAAARADLSGDSIHVEFAYPTSTTIYDNLGDYTDPGAGSVSGVSFTLGTTQLVITSLAQQTFLSANFNGFEFTDITKDPGIISVTTDPTSTFSASAVTFTSDEVFVNLQGVPVNTGDTLVLDLGFAAVPEPSSAALLGIGFLGLGGLVKRSLRQAV